MSKYPTTIENIEDLHLRHNKNRKLADGEHTNENTMNRVLAEDMQYGVEMTQADEVWALVKSRPNKYPSKPVKVCIIDTGYDVNHEDLPKSGVVTVTYTGLGSPLIDVSRWRFCCCYLFISMYINLHSIASLTGGWSWHTLCRSYRCYWREWPWDCWW